MARKTRKSLPKTESPQSFDALISIYVEHLRVRQYSPGTVELYGQRLLDFAVWCKERRLTRVAEVELDTLERYRVALLERGLAASTRHDALCILSVFFAWLHRKHHLHRDPADGLDLLPAKSRERQPITHADFERLADVIDLMTPLGLRDRAVVEVIYSTGMRISELCALELYDVDTARGVVTIRKGKGRKQRVVPIGARALMWLDRYLRGSRAELVVGEVSSALLFIDPGGRALRRRRMAARIRRHGEKALLPRPVGPHVLRHTTATEMRDRGADTRVLQELLGHSSLASTQRYTHLSIADVRAAHERSHPADKDASGFPPPASKKLPTRASRRRRKE